MNTLETLLRPSLETSIQYLKNQEKPSKNWCEWFIKTTYAIQDFAKSFFGFSYQQSAIYHIEKRLAPAKEANPTIATTSQELLEKLKKQEGAININLEINQLTQNSKENERANQKTVEELYPSAQNRPPLSEQETKDQEGNIAGGSHRPPPVHRKKPSRIIEEESDISDNDDPIGTSKERSRTHSLTLSPTNKTAHTSCDKVNERDLPCEELPLPLTSGISFFASDQIEGIQLTEQDINNVHSLIDQIANLDLLTLWSREEEIKAFGNEINEKVEPLPFLAIIFSHEPSKKNMLLIREHFRPFFMPDWMPSKWKSFVDGLAMRMEEEHKKNNLSKYIPAFAEKVGHTQNITIIEAHIKNKEWEALVLLLLDSD